MERTHHIKQRMTQRGISKRMVELVLNYGYVEHDKYVLRPKDAERIVAELQEDLRDMKKILDKGGVAVVVDGETLITTYNYKCHH
ncbi:DUF4258 domain-containing protein [Aeromonas caviae]|uniref:DUF4258 domain-containing protein n=1 Tax=Aeromonas caviae TaxID=648 RepID=UPI00101AEFEF|nr:DUF4258 domain-containing protein [Aeromonas caviae]BBG91783.1 hypothetical protein ACGSH8M1_p30120 [Aeromonas caviae]BBT55389.1 hypothetical protein WP8S18C01_P30060 [Aeromonas caviae]